MNLKRTLVLALITAGIGGCAVVPAYPVAGPGIVVTPAPPVAVSPYWPGYRYRYWRPYRGW